MGATDQEYGYWSDALPETYTELTRELASQSRMVNDKAFIEATTTVINGLNRTGGVVIIGRGANMILGRRLGRGTRWHHGSPVNANRDHDAPETLHP